MPGDERRRHATPARLIGVLDYNFGNFVHRGDIAAVDRPRRRHSRGRRRRRAPHELAVATFNVENLAPSDPQAKFDRLAGLIVNNLRAPDIDRASRRSRTTAAPPTTASSPPTTTMTKLIAAISAAGGPTYELPRRSTRSTTRTAASPAATSAQVFLFRTDRGLAFVDRPGGDSTDRGRRHRDRAVAAADAQPGPDRPDEHGLELQPQAAGGRVHCATASTSS